MATAKATYGVLDNVVLAYAKLAEPAKKYESNDLVYEVDCIVEKSVAKAWSKQFTKQKARELDKEDFEAKYKIPAPFDGDEVYIIKMRKAASKDGEIYDEKYRPQVLLDTADGERVNITTSRLLANGCKAQVSYRITENSFGVFGMLNNVLIPESGFLEYVSNGGGAGSEFGGNKVVRQEAPRKEATQARASKAADEDYGDDEPAKVVKKAGVVKKAAPALDEDFDNSPF